MTEHGFTPEQAQYVSQAALGLYALAMAFRSDIKREVRRRQEGICDCCALPAEHCLQIHHRVMESKGGSSTDIRNAVGLGGEKDCGCHQEVDAETMKGTIYPQVHTKERYYPQGNGL